MGYVYDDQNVFAKILRGEIPSSPFLETDHSFAFADIAPQAPTHILVIPRGAYVNYDHFAQAASDAEIVDFTRAVGSVCRMTSVSPELGDGYRLIANAGRYGVQDVPHMHVHILGGRALGRMLAAGS